MKSRIVNIAVILSVALVAGGPAFAKKPDARENSQAQSSQENSVGSPSHQENAHPQVYFNADRKAVIRNYYSKSQKPKNCPPGLAKKNNGCQPPGQAKKWRRGEALPREAVYSDVPGALIDELGRTPEGDKIVQIDSDLLLINTSTGMVLDAFDLQE
mgnify:CR=1 FL=1|tara:strand:+ start:29642 stop:30112 length:471 start_codon:yes stop_codon:yes gene_type:complete